MSWTSEAFKVVKAMPRPVDYRDIVDRTGMSDSEAQKCICRLLAAGCIRLASGSARTGRYYEHVPGSQLPPDGRGRHPNSQQALERAHGRMRASAPISQITAAKLTVSPLEPKRVRRKAASRPINVSPVHGRK